MKQINKDMIVAEVLQLDPGTAPFFLEIGMHALIARINEFLKDR